MKTIVSVTPLRVVADTRTYKQAASMSRFGYRSVVVEGMSSGFPPMALPFELRAVRRGHAPAASGQPTASQSASAGGGSMVRSRLTSMLRRLKNSFVGPPLVFLRYLVNYALESVVRPLRRIPPADLYYLHAPYYFPAIAILAWKRKARVIYDAHDFYSAITDPSEVVGVQDRWIAAFLRGVERACVWRADAVVTVSDGIADLYREAFGCDPVVLRNSHDARLERSRPSTLRETLGLSENAFLMVTIGQAKAGQAISEALDAMGELPPHVHLALLGRNYRQHEAEIARRGLAGRVHVVPAVAADEVVPFVRGADAALILYYGRSVNYVNCLPNGLFQAIAARLPLLYPELRGIRSLVGAHDLGFAIDPRSAASIHDGTLRLVNASAAERRERQERLRAAGVEWSWESDEVKLRELLTSLLDCNR